MASLKLSHIYKVYENGHKAVNDFNIDIEDKEFIVFVGPSGCGKSTTLRMVAGLEDITAGDLFIGDTLVNDIEPKDRDIAMVFQNYALYPHMTVYDNMAFGLKNKHVPNDVIREKVLEAAKILDIEDYLERKPKAMSGGQRQRVALGRAIVRDPKVFLLDEPLSNLDAKLRAAMRTEITKLHKKLQTTFIYVTHDQVEAMTMGTRIVVMKLGYVQQIDTPLNLYNKPGNKFVAGFIGTPQMNFFDVTLARKGKNVHVQFKDENNFDIDFERVAKIHDEYLHGDREVIFGIRPDHLKIVDHKTGIQAKVNVVEQLGNESIVYAQLNLGEDVEISSKDQIIVKIEAGKTYPQGEIINVEVNLDQVHFFDKETEVTLLHDIPDYSAFDAKVVNGAMDFLGSKVKLPPYLQEVLANHTNVTVHVPADACIDGGKDYSMDVHKVEEFGKKRLVSLVCGDRYLFLETEKEAKVGEKFNFSLENQKLEFYAEDGEVVLNPIGASEALLGRFVKQTEPQILVKMDKQWMNEADLEEVPATAQRKVKKVVKFYYEVAGVQIPTPMDKVVKITTIEGPACYTKEYKYVLDRKNIRITDDEKALLADVEKIVDYGNICYAKLRVGEQEILLEVEKGFDKSQIHITFDGKDVEVFQMEVDMRIC